MVPYDMAKHRKSKPIRDYLHNKELMIEQMFSCIPILELKNMVPIKLQGMPLHELKAECIIELLEMSDKEIFNILDGSKEIYLSSSESEVEDVLVISDDDTRNETGKPYNDSVVDNSDIPGTSSQGLTDKNRKKRKMKKSDARNKKVKTNSLKEQTSHLTVTKNKRQTSKNIDSKQPDAVEIVVLDDDESDHIEDHESDRGEKSLLDLLELEMRARAIRSLLKKEDEARAQKVLSEYKDEPDDLIPVIEEPPRIEILSDSEDSENILCDSDKERLSVKGVKELDLLFGLENKTPNVTALDDSPVLNNSPLDRCCSELECYSKNSQQMASSLTKSNISQEVRLQRNSKTINNSKSSSKLALNGSIQLSNLDQNKNALEENIVSNKQADNKHCMTEKLDKSTSKPKKIELIDNGVPIEIDKCSESAGVTPLTNSNLAHITVIENELTLSAEPSAITDDLAAPFDEEILDYDDVSIESPLTVNTESYNGIKDSERLCNESPVEFSPSNSCTSHEVAILKADELVLMNQFIDNSETHFSKLPSTKGKIIVDMPIVSSSPNAECSCDKVDSEAMLRTEEAVSHSLVLAIACMGNPEQRKNCSNAESKLNHSLSESELSILKTTLSNEVTVVNFSLNSDSEVGSNPLNGEHMSGKCDARKGVVADELIPNNDVRKPDLLESCVNESHETHISSLVASYDEREVRLRTIGIQDNSCNDSFVVENTNLTESVLLESVLLSEDSTESTINASDGEVVLIDSSDNDDPPLSRNEGADALKDIETPELDEGFRDNSVGKNDLKNKIKQPSIIRAKTKKTLSVESSNSVRSERRRSVEKRAKRSEPIIQSNVNVDVEVIETDNIQATTEVFELDDSDDANANWTTRWLESENVQRVVKTSKILTVARKQLKRKLKKHEVPVSTASLAEVPTLIGSIEEYHQLIKDGKIATTIEPSPEKTKKDEVHELNGGSVESFGTVTSSSENNTFKVDVTKPYLTEHSAPINLESANVQCLGRFNNLVQSHSDTEPIMSNVFESLENRDLTNPVDEQNDDKLTPTIRGFYETLGNEVTISSTLAKLSNHEENVSSTSQILPPHINEAKSSDSEESHVSGNDTNIVAIPQCLKNFDKNKSQEQRCNDVNVESIPVLGTDNNSLQQIVHQVGGHIDSSHLVVPYTVQTNANPSTATNPLMSVNINSTLHMYDPYYNWVYRQGLNGSLSSNCSYGGAEAFSETPATVYKKWEEYYRSMMEACHSSAVQAGATFDSYPTRCPLPSDSSGKQNYSWVYEHSKGDSTSSYPNEPVNGHNLDQIISKDKFNSMKYRYGLRGALKKHFVPSAKLEAEVKIGNVKRKDTV